MDEKRDEGEVPSECLMCGATAVDVGPLEGGDRQLCAEHAEELLGVKPEEKKEKRGQEIRFRTKACLGESVWYLYRDIATRLVCPQIGEVVEIHFSGRLQLKHPPLHADVVYLVRPEGLKDELDEVPESAICANASSAVAAAQQENVSKRAVKA